MESEKKSEIVPMHGLGYITRQEFEEFRRDFESYERRYIDQNKQIRKLREQYHALRRWQSWILGATAVGAYFLGHFTEWFQK